MLRLDHKLETFMAMTRSLSTLATCKRLKVGCMIVSHDFSDIPANGYNGWPHEFNHANCSGDPCGCVHAELNACIKLGRTGRTDNLCFVTRAPCVRCAQAIIQTKQIAKVFIDQFSPTVMDKGPTLLYQAGIYLEWWKDHEH